MKKFRRLHNSEVLLCKLSEDRKGLYKPASDDFEYQIRSSKLLSQRESLTLLPLLLANAQWQIVNNKSDSKT